MSDDALPESQNEIVCALEVSSSQLNFLQIKKGNWKYNNVCDGEKAPSTCNLGVYN
jgi:hypothetical protein